MAVFNQILKLQREVDAKLQGLGSKAASASKLTSYLYTHPLVNAERVNEIIGQSLPTAYSLIEEMGKIGILHEITGGKRSRMYLFRDYVELFK